MSAAIRVAVLGFSSFERNALASYFRLASRRNPAYEHVLAIDEARFVVADADQPAVPELLDALGRTHDAVFIGAQGPQDAAAWLMRPIDPAQVTSALDQLLALRDRPATGPLPSSPRPAAAALPSAAAAWPAPPPAVHSAERDGVPPARSMGDDGMARLSAAERNADALARRLRREAALRPVTVRRALLVDDSEVALAFLERQLHRHEIATDWAMNSNKAIELMSQQAYGMVFLEIDLGDHSDLDGLGLCQHIKRRHVHPNGRTPKVVLVSAFNDPVDRVRGTLAGADGHLGKPLDVAALDSLLLTQGLVGPATHGATPSR